MEAVSSCCSKGDFVDAESYWNTTFNQSDTHNWTEENPFVLSWISENAFSTESQILIAGNGDSILPDLLLKRGFKNIIVNDISQVALNRVKARLGNQVHYLHADLMNTSAFESLYQKIDLYVDRAALHFFTTCPEKDAYFLQLSKLMSDSGNCIIGVFSKNNEPTCCGLEVQLYSQESLTNRLSHFDVLRSESQEFIEKSGAKREYIYWQGVIKKG